MASGKPEICKNGISFILLYTTWVIVQTMAERWLKACMRMDCSTMHSFKSALNYL